MPNRPGTELTRRLLPALALAAVALAAGCATAPREPSPSGVDPGRAVAAIAEGLLGTPYRFGGSNDSGFDCSGLAVYAYERVGIDIPRTAVEQEHAAQPVPVRHLLPGDLLFFRIRSRRVDHVGIYVGGGRFVHAPRSGALVSYARLGGYFRAHLVRAGRFR